MRENSYTKTACDTYDIWYEKRNGNEKVAIYPYGEIGKFIESKMIETGLCPNLIVDNFAINPNRSIVHFDSVDRPSDYIWFIATYVEAYYITMRQELIDKGVKKANIIDVCGVEKKLENIKNTGLRLQESYRARINKVKEKREVHFGVYLVYAAEYGAYNLLKLILRDKKNWDVKIVVCPAIWRGYWFMKQEYEKTKQFAIEQYGVDRVLDGYNFEHDLPNDYSERFDLVYCDNCYDADVAKEHSIEYLSQKTLPFYISYGFDVSSFYNQTRLVTKELNYVWKCFVDTVFSYEDFKKYQLIRGENVVLSGYAKMDRLSIKDNGNAGKKKILIASHHTVDDKNLPLSNFLYYSEFFENLPIHFPQIQFVFRPHPTLFATLINKKIWSKDEVDDYIERIQKNGMFYSTEGDYLHLFSECDAIINDCGSFTIEWLYTGKPGCFMYRDELKREQLTELMNKAIEHYDIARSEKDIEEFINKIYDDEYTVQIDDWIRKDVMINYPNVSEHILNEIDIFA